MAEAYGWVFQTDGSPMANGNASRFESRDPGQAEVAGLAVNFQSGSLRGHVIKVELRFADSIAGGTASSFAWRYYRCTVRLGSWRNRRFADRHCQPE